MSQVVRISLVFPGNLLSLQTYLEYLEYFYQMRLFCKMENLVDVI